jgi:benzoyl-CoA reductase/2-hydroxyglutaryl-CoA dehydratase subunit BcrC/BadD/HgdB
MDVLAAYRERRAAALAAKRGGVPAVGYIGPLMPAEFILAAGAFPLLIDGDVDPSTPFTDKYLDHFVDDQRFRTTMDRVIRGDFAFVDLIVVAGCDERIYHFFNEVRRLGEGEGIPPLYLYDILQTSQDADLDYGLEQSRALCRRLRALTGQKIDEAALAKAISVGNARRHAMRRVAAMRGAEEMSGVQALRLLSSSHFVEPESYIKALSGDLAEKPGGGRPGMLIVPASPLFHDRLHLGIEAAGARVVAEDDVFGSRAIGADIAVNGDPLRAIFDKYHAETPGPQVHPQSRRFAWAIEQFSAPHVDAVIFYVPPSDHSFGWSYPMLKAKAAAAGKRQLFLRQDAVAESESITRAVAGFLAEGASS